VDGVAEGEGEDDGEGDGEGDGDGVGVGDEEGDGEGDGDPLERCEGGMCGGGVAGGAGDEFSCGPATGYVAPGLLAEALACLRDAVRGAAVTAEGAGDRLAITASIADLTGCCIRCSASSVPPPTTMANAAALAAPRRRLLASCTGAGGSIGAGKPVGPKGPVRSSTNRR
jgi:hypothetical protein